MGAKRKYQIGNENCFGNIDNEESAYWLGFLAADGCIRSDKNSVILKLMGSDVLHLEKLQKFLKTERPIHFYETYCHFQVNSKTMVDDLSKFGIVENKTKHGIKSPSIDDNLLKHFYRGLFDGDGSVSKEYKTTPFFNLTSSSVEILNDFGEFLVRSDSSISKFSICKVKDRENTYRIKKSGALMVYRCLVQLYENSNIYLERKHNSYLSFKKHYKDTSPDVLSGKVRWSNHNVSNIN